MNGGYIIISKNQADAYALSVKALELGKPVLFYEDDTTCYYIDTITKSGTDIVLTKGGKTITIESDGTITEGGDIQVNNLHCYLFRYENLNANDDGSDTDYELYFRYLTYDEIDDVNRQPLTQTIANEIIDNYDALVGYETDTSAPMSISSQHFTENSIKVMKLGINVTMYIYADTKYSITKLF